MHMIHRPSGERIHYQRVTEDGGEVAQEDIVKGYEYQKDKYVLFEPEELEKLRIESRDVIELVVFTDYEAIDVMYFDRPFFVVPDGAHAIEPFSVIREALRRSGKVGLGQMTMAGRERIVSLKPCGRGMLLETLRYKEELKKLEDFFGDIEDVDVPADQVAMASELIKRKSNEFDPAQFKDHYEEAVRKAVAAKLEGRKLEDLTEDETRQSVVINLTEALRQSLGRGSGGKAVSAKEPVKSPAKPARRRATAAPKRAKKRA